MTEIWEILKSLDMSDFDVQELMWVLEDASVDHREAFYSSYEGKIRRDKIVTALSMLADAVERNAQAMGRL
jgi:hypothetical protein